MLKSPFRTLPIFDYPLLNMTALFESLLPCLIKKYLGAEGRLKALQLKIFILTPLKYQIMVLL